MNQLSQTYQDAIIEASSGLVRIRPARVAETQALPCRVNMSLYCPIRAALPIPPAGNRKPQGRMVPAVLVGCERCGYLATHGLGVLGVLPPEEESR